MNERIRAAVAAVTLAASMVIAQQPTADAPATAGSAAEVAYRDAWWAETGKGDLDVALRGYLAAGAAAGPDAVRARALVAAAALQQRLGRGDAAMSTLQRVLREFESEREAVDRARAQLAELTAVDLRQSYDEWYDRQMFRESVQQNLLMTMVRIADLRIQLEKAANKERAVILESLDSERAQVRVCGKAAVPMLRRKVMEIGPLREECIDLLFRLGVVPPTAALVSTDCWVGDVDAWRLVLRDRSSAGPMSVAADRSLRATLLAAALRGPAELRAAILADELPPGTEDLTPLVTAAGALIAEVPEYTPDLLTADKRVPLCVRTALEDSFCNWQRPQLEASVWLDLAQRAQRFQARIFCLQAAVSMLRRSDAAQLDRALDMVVDVPESCRADAVGALVEGFRSCIGIADLEWTKPRTVRTLTTMLGAGFAGPQRVLTSLRGDDEGAANLAGAMLGDDCPKVLAADRQDGDSTLLHGSFVLEVSDDRDAAIAARRWHRACVAVLDSSWPQWNDEERLQRLTMLALVSADREREPLVDFARRRMQDAKGEVRDRLQAVVEAPR